MSLFPDDPDTPHSGSSFADHLASILAEEDDAGALDFLPPEDLAQINEANADGIPDMFERVTDARSVNKKSRDSRGILKIELLEGVSAELADHSKYGIPTVLHVSSLIYIGTSHGVVLVFNKKQRLGQVIGSPDNEFGAVSAVDADTTIASDRQVSDNAWIAVGHRSGRVLLWDRKANRVLKTISDAHFSPVMFAKFLPDRSLVTSDLKGSVLIHTFNRIFKIMVLETQCLVNGLVGSVLALSPCPSGRPTASHVTEKYSIVVMATMTKVIVFGLKPKIEVLFRIPRPTAVHPTALPYLAWLPPRLETEGDKTVVGDPLLAVAWGRHLNLIRLYHSPALPLGFKFVHVGQYITDEDMCGIQWQGPQVIMVLNKKEQVRVLDAVALTELELIDVSSTELVYHTRFSKESVKNPPFNYANSMMGSDKLYLMGLHRLFVCDMLSWSQRITVLVQEGRFVDALRLALEFYDGSAHVVVGLPRDQKMRRKMVSKQVMELLPAYVDIALSTDDPESNDATYADLATLSCECTLAIRRSKVLLEKVLVKFAAAGREAIFLEALEPFILRDELTMLSAPVMQAFLTHYESRGMVRRIEQCLLHMKLQGSSVDFHLIVTMCRTHELYSALLYVFNRGLDDYVTPLGELMVLIRQGLADEGTISETMKKNVGYKVLLYISYCFLGQAFPRGSIPPARASQVKREVAQWVFSSEEGEDAPVCLLLLLNACDFLKALSVLFAVEDSELTGGMDKASMADVLLGAVVDSEDLTPRAPYTASHVEAVLLFLAREIAACKLNHFSGQFLERIVLYLTKFHPTEEVRRLERQSVVLALLEASFPTIHDWGSESGQAAVKRIVSAAYDAAFHRVREHVHVQTGEHGKVIECYMQDQYRRGAVFDYIRRVLADKRVLQEEKEAVKVGVLASLQDLLRISSEETAKLVVDVLRDKNEEVIETLKPYPELLFVYIRGIVQDEHDVSLTQEVEERYIELMCEYRPEEVLPYLQGRDVRLDYCLELCKQHGVPDASAYLLERMGNLPQALGVVNHMLSIGMEVMISALMRRICPPDADILDEKEVKKVRKTLSSAIALCQRSSQHHQDEDSDQLWFMLLDQVVGPLRETKIRLEEDRAESQRLFGSSTTTSAASSHAVTRALTLLTGLVLDSMMGHVALPKIIHKIVDDHGSEAFGEFKSVIVGIVDTYKYEATLLQATNRLLADDAFRSSVTLAHKAVQGCQPRRTVCDMCERPFNAMEDSISPAKDNIKLFRCGHCFHGICADRCVACPLCVETTEGKGKQNEGSDGNGRRSGARPLHLDSAPTLKASTRNHYRGLDRWSEVSERRRVKLSCVRTLEQPRKRAPLQCAPPQLKDDIAKIAQRIPGSLSSPGAASTLPEEVFI